MPVFVSQTNRNIDPGVVEHLTETHNYQIQSHQDSFQVPYPEPYPNQSTFAPSFIVHHTNGNDPMRQMNPPSYNQAVEK